MTVARLKEAFRASFSTALRVKNGNRLADDDALLSSLGAVGADIEYDGRTTVGDFEHKVLLRCRLRVDVATPDNWVAALNDMPLADVRYLPAGMTVEKMRWILTDTSEGKADEEDLSAAGENTSSDTTGGKVPETQKKAKGLPPDYKVSVDEVERYAAKWDSLDGYVEQEMALRKLFDDLCPESTDMQDVLLKISVLNDFYSTNIYDVYSVAYHYVREVKDLDRRIREADPSVVDELAAVPTPVSAPENDRKVFHHYSFATKYCSHHNPAEYPIYDRYVRDVLMFFRRRDHFAEFKADDLKHYPRFKEVVDLFRLHYGLSQYNFKQIDNYLWQLGKDHYNPYK